jgi:hypothetical protein
VTGPDAATRPRQLVDGVAIFDDMPPDVVGRAVEVSVDQVAGFQPASERHNVPDSGLVRITLRRVETTTVVIGTVLDADGQPLAGAVIDLDHGLASASTDEHGAFRVEVPRLPGSLVSMSVTYKGRVGFREHLTVPGPLTLRWTP